MTAPLRETVTKFGLSEADRIRVQLYQSIRSPGLNPQNIFMLLVALLREEFPQERGEDLEQKGADFRRMIREPYPSGLGMDPAALWKLIHEFKHPNESGDRRRKEIVDDMKWMRQRVTRLMPGEAHEWGVNQYSGGVIHTSSDNDRRTVAGIIRRLNRDRPDLADKVARGDLSANAAAVEAGFRKKPTRFEQVTKLIEKLTPAERQKLKAML